LYNIDDDVLGIDGERDGEREKQGGGRRCCSRTTARMFSKTREKKRKKYAPFPPFGTRGYIAAR